MPKAITWDPVADQKLLKAVLKVAGKIEYEKVVQELKKEDKMEDVTISAIQNRIGKIKSGKGAYGGTKSADVSPSKPASVKKTSPPKRMQHAKEGNEETADRDDSENPVSLVVPSQKSNGLNGNGKRALEPSPSSKSEIQVTKMETESKMIKTEKSDDQPRFAAWDKPEVRARSLSEADKA